MAMTGIEGWLTRQWTHPSPAACLMWPLQALMQLAVRTRRMLYQHGWLATHALPVPVIVVGNRIAGGAGKTPTVMAVLAHLRAQGWTPGVLSRGHGRRPTAGAQPLVLDERNASTLSARDVGDEPWLIWRRTACPMGIARQRFNAGQALLAAHPEIDILVCDDGLQHLALARQVEIVVFDERGAGNGWLLPAGPLREPIHSPPHPACVAEPLVVYNAPQASTPLSGHLASKALGPLEALSGWWQGAADRAVEAAPDGQQPIIAVAGIAQPQRFFQSLQAQGLSVTPCPMPDHDSLDPLPWGPEVSQVIMTEKDAVKLTPERLAAQRPRTRVWVAPLSFEIAPAFWQALDRALALLPRAR
jgi:tetraacyldisaccharide 4'-kinase